MLKVLEVPYFRQVALGSCGPASLLMVLKYHRPEMKLSRLLEFKAWVAAEIFPFGMTESFGLALFAVQNGFRTLVLKEESGFHMSSGDRYVGRRLFSLMLPIFKLNYRRLLSEALSRGLEVKYEEIDLEVIREFVEKKLPPIVMVDQTGYAYSREYPYGMLHWVVVTGFEDEMVLINDPDLGPNLRVSKDRFVQALDVRRNFQTDRRLVVIVGDDSIRTGTL